MTPESTAGVTERASVGLNWRSFQPLAGANYFVRSAAKLLKEPIQFSAWLVRRGTGTPAASRRLLVAARPARCRRGRAATKICSACEAQGSTRPHLSSARRSKTTAPANAAHVSSGKKDDDKDDDKDGSSLAAAWAALPQEHRVGLGVVLQPQQR